MFIQLMRRMCPLFDEDSDGGGGSAAALKVVADKVDGVAETFKETTKKVEDIGNELVTMKADSTKEYEALASQVKLVRDTLGRKYGKSGAEDWLMDMSKFLSALFALKCGKNVPAGQIGGTDLKDLLNKAVVDFTTTTAATAGYLVPDVLLPGITELKDIYGNFYPEVTKVTAAAGQSILINRDAASPVAYWRSTQLSGMTEEATPMSFDQDTMVSQLLGTFIQIANEMLMAPGVNFSAVAVVRMVKAILRKLEFGLISGTTGAGEPSDGLIADATDQGTIATMSFANLIVFLKACITDNEFAYDTQSNVIIMTPYDALSLAGEQGGSPGALVWGNSLTGVPTTLMGYRLITHPAANNGSSKHILLGDPSTITLIESAATSVDISGEAGTAFTEYASLLRVLNHYDWNLGQVSEWHKSVVTA